MGATSLLYIVANNQPCSDKESNQGNYTENWAATSYSTQPYTFLEIIVKLTFTSKTAKINAKFYHVFVAHAVS
jgi:hypothetical protein